MRVGSADLNGRKLRGVFPRIRSGWDVPEVTDREMWPRPGAGPGVAACRGDDGDGITASRRTTRCSGRGPLWNERRFRSASAEQRTTQPAQRREEQDTTHALAPCTALTRGVTRRQLTHQQGCLGRFPLWDGRASQHREVAVEARTGRAAPARDRRDPGPAAHCYLFHVTPHPYESTRPGQGNPIAPSGHSCIAVTGFTFPVRVLTTLRSSLSESNRFQGELDNGLAGGLR